MSEYSDFEVRVIAAEMRDDLPQLDLHNENRNIEDMVDQFLTAHQTDETVKIIYGIGTGKLADRVLKFLNSHPMVVHVSERPGNCIVVIE